MLCFVSDICASLSLNLFPANLLTKLKAGMIYDTTGAPWLKGRSRRGLQGKFFPKFILPTLEN